MGGDISVQSTVGLGSTFRVNLPLSLSTEANQGKSHDRSLSPGLRVLVVDDIQINRDVVGQLLVVGALRGLDCELRRGSAEALSRKRFDVVLMDIRMPGMDGLAATAAIRAGRGIDRIRLPVLGLTANPLPTDRPLFLLRGIDGVIEKPVEREQLRAALVRYSTAAPVAITVIPPRLGSLLKDLGSERQSGSRGCFSRWRARRWRRSLMAVQTSISTQLRRPLTGFRGQPRTPASKISLPRPPALRPRPGYDTLTMSPLLR